MSTPSSAPRSARSISSASAALIASRHFGPSGIDVLEHGVRVGVRSHEGGLDGGVHLFLGRAGDLIRGPVVGERAARELERVTALKLEQLALGAVCLGVAFEVAAE